MTARLLTRAEVAGRFRTSPKTVAYWQSINYGPVGVRVGRRVLYSEDDVEHWYASLLANAAQEGGVR